MSPEKQRDIHHVQMKNKASLRNLNVAVLPFYEPRVPCGQIVSELSYPRMAENLFAGPSNCWNQMSSKYSKARNSSGVNNSQLQSAGYKGDKQLTGCSCDGIFICTYFIETIHIRIREIIPLNELIQSLQLPQLPIFATFLMVGRNFFSHCN